MCSRCDTLLKTSDIAAKVAVIWLAIYGILINRNILHKFPIENLL